MFNAQCDETSGIEQCILSISPNGSRYRILPQLCIFGIHEILGCFFIGFPNRAQQ